MSTPTPPPPPSDLPDGLVARPLTVADAGAVFAVMAAQEQHDIASVQIEEADIVADWQRPGVDVPATTVGVLDGDALVAYAEHSGGERGDAAVHPSYRGRGLGTALARWMQDCARGRGETLVGMPVPEGSDGDRLLAALGYRHRWTSWLLELPPGVDVSPQEVPPGYGVREAAPTDHRAVWQVVDDAFGEWSHHEPEPWGDFEAVVLRRPGFAPWTLRVATDPSGEVVGVAVVMLSEQTGYVDRLAVRRDHRGRGLARALLVDAFGQARAHGATRLELATDTRSGARDLYERVGMRVFSTWINRAIDL